MREKGFLPIWLIIVIIVAVISGGAVVVSQKTKVPQPVSTPTPEVVAPLVSSVTTNPVPSMEGLKGAITAPPQLCLFGMPSCKPLPSGCRYDKKDICSCGEVICTPSISPTASPTATPKPSPKLSPRPSPTASAGMATPTPAPTATPTPTPLPTPTPTATPTPTPTLTPTPSPSPTPTPVATAEINFSKINLTFSPNDLTVMVGTAVTFKNNAITQNIWVASNPHPMHTDLPGFDSGTLEPGQSYTFIFNTVGNWGYHNHISPGVGGTVHVVTSF